MTATTPFVPVVPQAPPVSDGRRLTDATVCINLVLGGFGSTAKVDGATMAQEVAVDADKAMLRLSKKILQSDELRQINRHDIATRGILRDNALPSMFRGGVYLVPARSVERLWNWLERERKPQREDLVSAFLAAYPAACESMREPLGRLYSSINYPDVATVAESFTFDFQIMAFDTPSRLRDISPALFAIEREKAEVHFQEAANEVRVVLRQQMAELVDHMVDRLSPDVDGKRKRFHASSIDRTTAWLTAFSERNVLGDAELDALVQSAKSLVEGTDAEAIRTDEAYRDRLAQGFSSIRLQLDALVGTERRVIDLDALESAPAPAAEESQSDASAAA